MNLKLKEQLFIAWISLLTGMLGASEEAHAWSKGATPQPPKASPPPPSVNVPIPNSTVNKNPSVPNRAPIKNAVPPTTQNEFLAGKKFLKGGAEDGIPIGFPEEIEVTDEGGNRFLIRFNKGAGLTNRNMEGWPETEFEPLDQKTKLPLGIKVQRYNSDAEDGWLIKIKTKFDPANGPVQITEMTIKTWELNEIGGWNPIFNKTQPTKTTTMIWSRADIAAGLIPPSALALPATPPADASAPASQNAGATTPKASDGY